MKKTVRKLISVLLVSVMLLTMAPLSGFMGISLPTVDWDKLFTPKASAATNGTCGENLTWTLDDDGTLTISGTGDMTDYLWYSPYLAPWHGNTYIKKVVIREGVTSIGDSAFNGCSAFTEITIPESVTSIGDFAFSDCSSLKKVNITDIESWCKISFSDYSSNPLKYGADLYLDGEKATNLTIPDTITEIKDYAFAECMSLTEITIPESVTSIGAAAFSGCDSLDKVNITDIESWCKISFSDYSSNPLGYGVDLYLDGEKVTEITIPDTVTEIKDYAFSWYISLTEITIPESVTFIGYDAFSHCESLTAIKIPKSVISIGEYAFSGCCLLSDVELHEGITSIGDGAFNDCDALVTIDIPASVTFIGRRAFGGCRSLCEINVNADNETYLSDDGVLFDREKTVLICCPGGKSSDLYTIPDGVTELESYSFSGCSNISEISIPSFVTEIGEYAFSGCTSLESIFISDSITELDSGLFNGCSSLKTVTFDEDIKLDFIQNSVFYGCYSLENITLPEGLRGIGSYAFGSCHKLEELKLPDSLRSIGQRAFANCSSLTTINLPAGFDEYGLDYSFADSCFTSITVDKNNLHFAAKDGVLFNNSFTELVHYPNNKAGVSYVIPDSVTEVRDDAFANVNLQSIIVPYSVATIHVDSFSECGSLTKLVFANPDCMFSYEYYSDAFPSGVTVYGYENSNAQHYAENCGVAFEIFDCDHSESETLDKVPATCIKDGHEAGVFCHICGASVKGFEVLPALNVSVGCTDKNDDDICDFCAAEREVTDSGECGENLKWKLYSDGLLRIFGTGDMWDYEEIYEYDTDEYYYSAPWAAPDKRLLIKDVIVEEGVTCIGVFSFAECKNIENLYIADSVTTIRAQAFVRCYLLENIYFSKNSNLKEIQTGAFGACTSLEKVILPDSLTEIGTSAYAYCSSVSEVIISANVISIGSNAFYECPIESVTVDSANKFYSSENGVLYDENKNTLILYPPMKADDEFNIPDTVNSISDRAFNYNKYLTSVYVPSGVAIIGEYAFRDCDALTSVTFGDGSRLQYISNGMFYSCNELENIELPYGVSLIDDYAFYCCYALSHMLIPDSVKSIGSSAFESCSMESITVPYSVNTLYADAFDYSDIQKITIANPDCEIDGETYGLYSEPVIAGYENSTAQTFAEAYGLTFEIFECDHSARKKYDAVSPTCTTVGRTEGEGCPVCGLCYNGIEEIPALNPEVGCVDENFDEKCDLCGRTFIVIGRGMCGDNIIWKVYGHGHMAISGTGDMWDYDLWELMSGMSIPQWLSAGWNMVVSSVSVSEGVTRIGTGSFLYFSQLRKVSLPDSLISIGEGAFMSCPLLEEIILPDSVTSLGMMAIGGCESLSYVHLGSGINLVDTYLNLFITGGIGSLKKITVDEDNQFFCEIDGMLYSKDKKVLYFCADTEGQTSFTVPEGVTFLFAAGLTNFSELTSITIPQSVEIIGGTFENCPNLTDIIVDENHNAYVTTDGVLYSKDMKLLVSYPAGKTDKSFTVPDGVEYISSYAFSDCTYLETVTIPDSVKDIGNSAFSGCTSLSDIKFSGNSQLESIGADAFNNTAYFDDDNNWVDGVLYIEDFIIDSRYLCDTEYYVKDGTKGIADNAFSDVIGVENIYIPDSVTYIGSCAFRGYFYDFNLCSITVDENNKNYCSENGVLYNKDKTELICYPSGKTEASFTVPDSVTKISDYAFYSCKNLTDITVGDNVQQIGTYAFEGSGYASDMSNWEDGMLYVGNHLIAMPTDIFGFSDISGDFIIKEGTKTIADQVISLVKEPVNITLPESLSYISCYNLSSVMELKSITVLNPDCIIADAEMINQVKAFFNLDVVVYGYKNSTAEEFAEKAGLEFVALDGTDECDHKLPEEWTVTTEPAIGIPGTEVRKCLNCEYTEEREIPALELTVSDKEGSNIGISDTDGAFDAEDGEVSADILKDTSAAQYILSDLYRISSWNITFRNENGDEIQPKKPVTVRMPIPSDYNVSALMVMHIDPETSDAEFVPFTIEDGYVVFSVSDFSIYVLVDTSSEKEDITPEEPDAPEEPETPDDSCSHMCHKDGFIGFIWKIINFFQKLFGINSVCECGAAHY